MDGTSYRLNLQYSWTRFRRFGGSFFWIAAGDRTCKQSLQAPAPSTKQPTLHNLRHDPSKLMTRADLPLHRHNHILRLHSATPITPVTDARNRLQRVAPGADDRPAGKLPLAGIRWLHACAAANLTIPHTANHNLRDDRQFNTVVTTVTAVLCCHYLPVLSMLGCTTALCDPVQCDAL